MAAADAIAALPVDELLLGAARGVVRAQQALDAASLASELRLREAGLDRLGLTAHWYSIPETDFRLRLAFEVTQQGEVRTHLVDADYQSRYGFNVKASSDLHARIVALPPVAGGGLSLLEADAVVRAAGRLKRVVEAWDACDTPRFVARYQAFAASGYDGGLWTVLLVDRTAAGETRLRALVAIDDASGEVLRLWTEPAPPAGFAPHAPAPPAAPARTARATRRRKR
jgi:hypothetical protein